MQPRLDIFNVLIFLGVIQGAYLSFFFMVRKAGRNLPNRILGWFLLSISAMIFEIFLCRSNFIVKIIHLVDFSEPFNFLVGPLIYLFISVKLANADRLRIRQYLHLVPFVFYLLYSTLFFLQSPAFKTNAFLSAYHPDLPHIPTVVFIDPDPLYIKNYVNELTLFQNVVYIGLSVHLLSKAFKERHLSFFSSRIHTLSWLRNVVLCWILAFALLVFVKLSFVEDLGDYLTASYLTVVVYAINFSIMMRSAFFRETVLPQGDKYEKSSLTDELKERILAKLQQTMADEKPYLDDSLSLPALARAVAVSPHHLSQVLNDSLNQNFFEYIGRFRVEEAKKMLSDRANINLKMEEVARRVGYLSKSAFNTAFKKHTGMTPSRFRELKTKSSSEIG